MLRLVSRSPSASSPPAARRISRSSLNNHHHHHQFRRKSTTTLIKDWQPGDPIYFNQANMQQPEQKKGNGWTPGQPIKFATASLATEGNSKGGTETQQNSRAEGSRLGPDHAPRRTASPTTTRATFNSSPSSSLDVSGNTSWEASHRWDPPSPSNTSLEDVSSGSTAIFSHSRSYARVSNSSRSVGGPTAEVEEAPDGNFTRKVEFGNFLTEDHRKVEKVDVAVQTEMEPEVPKSRALAPAPSKEELDDLLAGVDFEDDSLEFDVEPSRTESALPNTSTPTHLRHTQPQLTQPEVEDLVGGIDFSQDLDMSDPEETQESFHSAIASPFPTPSRPRSRSPEATHTKLSPSPRIIVRNPRTVVSPSPPPRVPSEPDVFTLSSTPPVPYNATLPPHLKKATKTPRSIPISSPLLLASSSQPSSSTALPSHVRSHSTTAQAQDSDESLIEPTKLKGWDSVVKTIESSQIDYSGDSSVEIIEPRSKPTKPMHKVNKLVDLKGKGKAVEKETTTTTKENKPPNTATTATKPGYFTRPASLKPSVPANSTSTKAPLSTTSASLTTSSAHSRKGPREPLRESFKGRNAEERYKSAHKQYTLQLKWPKQFDYTTWGNGGNGGKKPRVVFTTEERVVDQVLKGLEGPMGFDLEWDMFDTKTRGQGKTALVQVCDQKTILLVQVAKMRTFPRSLKDFIEDPAKIKLGVQIGGDARKLERDYGFKPKGLLELNDLVKRFDPQHHAHRQGPLIGLQELVGIYLDRYLPKDHSVRCGVWSGVLSDAQKSYGANDVYSSLHVLLALESLISSATGTTLELLDFTTPNAKFLPVIPSTNQISTSTNPLDAIAVPTGLESLPPRKLQAYHLFQIEKLPLKDVATKMSETSSIKHTSVLWNLLGVYAAMQGRKDVEVDWDEERLVEAVDSLGSLFTGKMKAEHGQLVEGLREKVGSGGEPTVSIA